MFEIILVVFIASVSGDLSNISVGEYECHKYDGTEHKNDWHYVTITYNENTNTYTWKNRAGVHWTLYPLNTNNLRVGKDCPYFKNGHHIAKFTGEGVYGPWNELYERKSIYVVPTEGHVSVSRDTSTPSTVQKTVKKCVDLRCSSWKFAYATCKVPSHQFITKVSLKKQHSRTNCRRPTNKFGVIGNKIWVDKGCRGTFTYCYQVKKPKTIDYIQCESQSPSESNECYVQSERRITQVSLVDGSNCRNNFGIGINDNKIWVRKGCSGYFKYKFIPVRNIEKTRTLTGISDKRNQLAVSWGQDYSGKEGLLPERNLTFYCDNRGYDMISLSFVDIKSNANNGDQLPRIALSNHCFKTFPGYDDLLDCKQIGEEIKRCQEKGKKITLGLRGLPAQNVFKDDASLIWNMFLGGKSHIRPFGDAILDGIDIYTKHQDSNQHVDFVQMLKKHMTADQNRKYLINAVVTDIFSYKYMKSLRNTNHFLLENPQEFDQLYLKNFNKLPVDKHELEMMIKPWFKLAEGTRKAYGKGPLIFVGLSDHPNAKEYIPPDRLEDIRDIAYNENCGGAMIWDASFDSLNQTDIVHYSAYVYGAIHSPEIAICPFPGWPGKILFNWEIVKEVVCVIAILLAFIAILKFSHIKYRSHKNTKVADGKVEPATDASIEKVKMGDMVEISYDGNVKV